MPMTMPDGRPARALVLMSGGLDSRLAVCVLRDQGIEVTGLSFTSPFFGSANAEQAAGLLGVPLIVEDFTGDIVSLVEHPPHGFGSYMNPCIDCHTAMLRRAGRIMERDGFQLVATGEVLNQRPMSQNRRSLEIVARGSGCGDRVLRPLSAKLLPETEPERLGWVDRERLLALEGRSRRPQFALAERFGLKDWPEAAGGCKLTEPNFSGRLRDLRKHEGLKDIDAIRLLKLGRHFRLGPSVRAVIGRDAQDNAALEQAATDAYVVLQPVDVPGPTALIAAGAGEADVLRAAGIAARYCHAGHDPVEFEIAGPSGKRRLRAPRMPPAEVDRLRVT